MPLHAPGLPFLQPLETIGPPSFSVDLASFSLHQCETSSEGPPLRCLLLAARHSWWLQLISESGNIVDNVVSETWKALSRCAICGMFVWVGPLRSLCPLTATLTTPSSSPTANCSKLTRSLSSFRDMGKQNFLADASKSSMPFGIVIWSFCWGRVEGVWVQHWVRDSSGESRHHQ